jgi:uncharacterized protein YndB with AHSA1/START domain
MESYKEIEINVETTVNSSIEKVWTSWTEPEHIINWYHASEDWHAPTAENDLRVNGSFKTYMAAKDGSVGFNFEGIYTKVEKYKEIEYKIIDGRKVKIVFMSSGNVTHVSEIFHAEKTNSIDLQKAGWQAILDNFKKYTETTLSDK